MRSTGWRANRAPACTMYAATRRNARGTCVASRPDPRKRTGSKKSGIKSRRTRTGQATAQAKAARTAAWCKGRRTRGGWHADLRAPERIVSSALAPYRTGSRTSPQPRCDLFHLSEMRALSETVRRATPALIPTASSRAGRIPGRPAPSPGALQARMRSLPPPPRSAPPAAPDAARA